MPVISNAYFNGTGRAANPIEDKLATDIYRKSGNKASVRNAMANSSDSILSSELRFVKGPKLSFETDELKRKYTVLSSNTFQPGTSSGVKHVSPSKQNQHSRNSDEDDNMPAVKCQLFEIAGEQIVLRLQRPISMGGGLLNHGNTCFLNSVLQALAYTPPLLNYLGGFHSDGTCKIRAVQAHCALCDLNRLIRQIHLCKPCAAFNFNAVMSNRAADTRAILNRMKTIMKTYIHGRQEDAHEFLRHLVDYLQTAALAQFRGMKLDHFTKETTAVSKIFGGIARNQVKCQACSAVSTTFDPFYDISLDIKNFNHLNQSLKHYTRTETLDASNAYKCEKCKRAVSAQKSYTFHKLPMILTVHLKRFDHMGKINKHVTFPEELNMTPFTTRSVTQQQQHRYWLYAVVVHNGMSTHSGHYYSFVRHNDSPTTPWHQVDDDRVSTVNKPYVLDQRAYLLFYCRTPDKTVQSVRPVPKTIGPSPAKQPRIIYAPRMIPVEPGAQKPFIGPHLPPSAVKKANVSSFLPRSVAKQVTKKPLVAYDDDDKDSSGSDNSRPPSNARENGSSQEVAKVVTKVTESGLAVITIPSMKAVEKLEVISSPAAPPEKSLSPMQDCRKRKLQNEDDTTVAETATVGDELKKKKKKKKKKNKKHKKHHVDEEVTVSESDATVASSSSGKKKKKRKKEEHKELEATEEEEIQELSVEVASSKQRKRSPSPRRSRDSSAPLEVQNNHRRSSRSSEERQDAGEVMSYLQTREKSHYSWERSRAQDRRNERDDRYNREYEDDHTHRRKPRDHRRYTDHHLEGNRFQNYYNKKHRYSAGGMNNRYRR